MVEASGAFWGCRSQSESHGETNKQKKKKRKKRAIYLVLSDYNRWFGVIIHQLHSTYVAVLVKDTNAADLLARTRVVFLA